ncbi:hypothetical protein [Candidatus Viadribacter manganicus]|uniref:Uncharacterized protein n=1 Tax=Candidatus Viadribacter manganicus TaxID=1759059 RepID=A0A1B1AHM1_9PROT|nr:hypothetical protein [Candidatus Viadribacter manganicus]ANP46066.1 hypothetical protein ATE48_09100 [Candidatus Viadribacter manganicus]
MNPYEAAVFEVEVAELWAEIECAIARRAPVDEASACAVMTALLNVMLEAVEGLPAHRAEPLCGLVLSEFASRGRLPPPPYSPRA